MCLSRSETKDLQQYQEVHWSGNSLKRHHRVGFIIKIDPNVELIQVEYPNARIIVFHAKVYRCLLKVINGYAPTEESSDSTKNVFYKTLSEQFLDIPAKHKVICLGDFNATTSAASYNSSLRGNSVIENLIV